MSGRTSESVQTSQQSRLINLQDRLDDAAHQYSEQFRRQSTQEPSAAEARPISKYQPSRESTAGQSALPLQWIDEQELRQNKSGLRKTVRSYARRDTCLRQQRKNAASKPTSNTLRSIIEKSGSDVPPRDRSHAERQLDPSGTPQSTQSGVPQNRE
jgi:hypothetical protein